MRTNLLAGLLLAVSGALGCTGSGGGSSAVQPITYQPRASLSQLSMANGFAAAVLDTGSSGHRVSAFRDHIYAASSAAAPSKDFCQELFFGYRRAGMSQWLSGTIEQETAFVPGTGIARTVQRAAGLAFETFYFTPMTGGADTALVAIVHVTNAGAAAQDCALFSYMDFHLGGDADATAEWAWNYAAGAVMEGKQGTGDRIAYRALGSLTHWSAGSTTIDNPLSRVNAGGHLTDGNGGATPADDIRVGFESAIAGGGSFASGADAWFGVALMLREDGDEAALQGALDGFVGTSTPQDLLSREEAYWTAFHASEIVAPGATPDEAALVRQATATIKMAQCREAGPAGGQIVASLPPGQWNITWVRDACYAIRALTASGHLDEAKAGLSFFLNASAGQFQSYVGKPYAISVCRYTGAGVEESDDNGDGPNVELDGFGLFLGALRAYVDKSGDTTFLTSAWPIVRDGVADVLAGLVAQNGLIAADSSIWERHQTAKQGTPDGKKQFAYTSIQASIGLDSASALAALMGDTARATSYQQAASDLSTAISSSLTISDVICDSVEDLPAGLGIALDGSTLEAVNGGVVAPTSRTALATVGALEGLRTFGLLSPGYLRGEAAETYGPDNWYDRQEWVFIDLRAASAFATIGHKAEARVLLDWVIAQSRANFDEVAELYDEGSADYRGSIPMVGFGAGAFVLASWDVETR